MNHSLLHGHLGHRLSSILGIITPEWWLSLGLWTRDRGRC